MDDLDIAHQVLDDYKIPRCDPTRPGSAPFRKDWTVAERIVVLVALEQGRLAEAESERDQLREITTQVREWRDRIGMGRFPELDAILTDSPDPEG